MRTVWWENGSLRMIDQRLIPEALEILDLSEVPAVAGAIQAMAVRGAPAIGAAAAYGMAVAARRSPAESEDQLLDDLQAAAETLSASRPTASNLAWAVRRVLKAVETHRGAGPEALRQAALMEAERIADEDVKANRRLGEYGAELVRDGDTLLHHCNTGPLATVDWGTAEAVFLVAHEQGKRIHVLVDETRPRLQGAKLTVWELGQRGVPFTLIADNAAGHFLQRGRVQAVFVGTDRTAANGDVANKIGTYKLAVVARENNVPFYVALPTSTLDLSVKSGDEIPIEERDPDEVAVINGTRIVPEGTPIANPAFDITPHRYVTAFVTEYGVIYPPFQENLRRIKEQAERG